MNNENYYEFCRGRFPHRPMKLQTKLRRTGRAGACSRRFLYPTVTLHIKTAPKSSFLLIKNTDFETPGLVYKNLEKNLKKLLTFVARFDNIYERQEQSTNECGGKRRNGP